MTHRWKATLGLAVAITTATAWTTGQEKKGTAPHPAFVPAPLPVAPPSEALEQFKRQLRQADAAAMIAARDPETGQLGAPDAKTHAALTGGRGDTRMQEGARFAEAAPTISLPDGGVAIRTSITQMEFLVAERQPDGSIRYVCNNPLHNHSRTEAGRELRNDQ